MTCDECNGALPRHSLTCSRASSMSERVIALWMLELDSRYTKLSNLAGQIRGMPVADVVGLLRPCERNAWLLKLQWQNLAAALVGKSWLEMTPGDIRQLALRVERARRDADAAA